jgi:KipI family sensor histidine kinase inhibitor
VPDSSAGASAAIVEPFGDSAVLVRLESRIDPAIARRAGEIAAAIEAARWDMPALGRPVPAHASVLVPFDPLTLPLAEAAELIHALAADAPALPGTADERPLEIGVRYGGADGPDLAEVAERLGRTPDQVAELHASTTYTVAFLGFAPGFGYLGGLPAELQLPRRATPRERVPAGSVGIAGAQTAVYPGSMPGGWHLIGRTDAVLFDPAADPPTPLQPGRRVRFVPIR